MNCWNNWRIMAFKPYPDVSLSACWLACLLEVLSILSLRSARTADFKSIFILNYQRYNREIWTVDATTLSWEVYRLKSDDFLQHVAILDDTTRIHSFDRLLWISKIWKELKCKWNVFFFITEFESTAKIRKIALYCSLYLLVPEL